MRCTCVYAWQLSNLIWHSDRKLLQMEEILLQLLNNLQCLIVSNWYCQLCSENMFRILTPRIAFYAPHVGHASKPVSKEKKQPRNSKKAKFQLLQVLFTGIRFSYGHLIFPSMASNIGKTNFHPFRSVALHPL